MRVELLIYGDCCVLLYLNFVQMLSSKHLLYIISQIKFNFTYKSKFVSSGVEK